ncbi:hypothetical protein UCDDA912_g10113 [Diaporthe ampelina]|uniref:Uncharacterized protein n=1 Tax=Diaporthe ampelina TaxID=1214573 RepID=A0A0G2F5A1_9PEZI|nr:hypothetical protein UCDDA912_g10113 [Diaporthe ampelina]
MLCLRGTPPRRFDRPPLDGYDYELRRLKTDGASSSQQGKAKGYRAKELYLAATMKPMQLQNMLQVAYRFLDPERALRSKGKKATIPVEFHVQAQGRPRPPHADLSQFTLGRVDLHPAVILRALPADVFQVLEPKADLQSGDAVWVVATKYLRMEPFILPNTPDSIARKVETIVNEKKERLKGLVDAKGLIPKQR